MSGCTTISSRWWQPNIWNAYGGSLLHQLQSYARPCWKSFQVLLELKAAGARKALGIRMTNNWTARMSCSRVAVSWFSINYWSTSYEKRSPENCSSTLVPLYKRLALGYVCHPKWGDHFGARAFRLQSEFRCLYASDCSLRMYIRTDWASQTV
jgi:hypothetical protein